MRKKLESIVINRRVSIMPTISPAWPRLGWSPLFVAAIFVLPTAAIITRYSPSGAVQAPAVTFIDPSVEQRKSVLRSAFAMWPQEEGLALLSFNGEPTVPKPAKVVLPTSSKPRKLLISLSGESEGALYASFSEDDEIIEGWHIFNTGRNEFVIDIPAKIKDETVWLLRDTKRGTCHIDKLAVANADGSVVPASSAIVVGPTPKISTSGRRRLAAWPIEEGAALINFNGDTALKESEPILIPGSDKPRRLMINLNGAGRGAMYVGYRVDGKTKERWYVFNSGTNTIQIDLPPHIDGETVWLVRDKDHASLQVTGLAIDPLD